MNASADVPAAADDRRDVHLGVNAVGAVMGGAARHLAPFLHALQVARPTWRFTVWANPEAAIDETDRLSLVRVPRLSIPGRLGWENRQLTRELTQAGATALINLTNSGPLRPPVPSVLYQRNPIWFDRRWLRRTSRRYRLQARARRELTFLQARGSSTVVVPTAAMGGFLRSWNTWPRRVPVDVVHHAVDQDRFTFAPRTWPPDRPVRLVAVSHGAPHKDQMLLIDLVRELHRRGEKVDLTATIDPASEDPYIQSLVARVAQLDLGDSVHLVGSVGDVERLYHASDISLSSSITESFGFPLLEAMSAGVPMLASRIDASTEVLGPDGWYHEVGDVDDAATQIQRLLCTPAGDIGARLERCAQRARTFNWTANAERLATVVEAALATPPARIGHRRP